MPGFLMGKEPEISLTEMTGMGLEESGRETRTLAGGATDHVRAAVGTRGT